jgi:hypothetical protein
LAARSQVIGGFQRDTNQIPIIIGDVFRGSDTQITGVSPVERPEPGTNYDPGAQNPGFYAPTDSAPGSTYTMNPAVLAGPIVAVDRVANNLVAADVPGANTFQAVESSARRLGVTGVQVQSLVRTNGFEAVNSVYKTAYDGGTPQQVAKATVDGAVHVTQAFTGAPVGTVMPDGTAVSAGSVRNLGAVGSVAKSVSDAANSLGAGVKKDLGGGA